LVRSASSAGTITSVWPPRAACLNGQPQILARHRHLERRRGVLAGADALGALRQRLAGVEVLEQAERVFHVDAHRGGQPAHVTQDPQDAQQREVAEQLEKGRR